MAHLLLLFLTEVRLLLCNDAGGFGWTSSVNKEELLYIH